ncbi:MAG TPA: glycosyltransferase [Sphingobium sp.]|nr:glycosyltransferase [Sphingobium sp.]
MKILHVITALNVGGAETMLAKLVEHEGAQAGDDQPCVVSLMAPGAAGERVRANGTPVRDCGLTGLRSLPRALSRLRAIIRDERPDLIMAWMYHAHLAALAATLLQGRPIPLIWNVRHSVADLSQEKPSLRLIVRLAAWLSRWPRVILYNSSAAAQQHQKIGFQGERTMVIPNGFDCDRFRPREDARSTLAARLGIDPAALIVGMAARNHPMKDAPNLVEAIKRVRNGGIDAHLLLTGEGMDRPSGRLAELIAELPADRVTLQGHDRSLAELLPGLDLLVLPSAWGEGFPNILGEAMACGTPCIATDVGDGRWIVGEKGIVVPPRDPEQLAGAIVAMEKLGPAGRRRLGKAARDHVERHFSMNKIGALYNQLYQDAAGAAAPPQDQSPPKIRQAQVM